MSSLSFHSSTTLLHGFDNVLVTRATAQIAFEQFANFEFAGVGVAVGNVDRAHDHARCAEAALQAMAFFECGLHGVHGAIGLGHTFNGGNFGALCLCGEHVARLDGTAVDMNGTCATLGCIAAHVGAGEFEVLAQCVDEQSVGGCVNGN